MTSSSAAGSGGINGGGPGAAGTSGNGSAPSGPPGSTGNLGMPIDGMEGSEAGGNLLRFGRDRRLSEVQRLLGTNMPVILMVPDASDSDPDLPAKQQAALLAAAMRTMALPLGRGAFTLGLSQLLPGEHIVVPLLCLSGLVAGPGGVDGAAGSKILVNLDLTNAQPAPGKKLLRRHGPLPQSRRLGGGAAADVTAWCEFHNGVAAGIKVAPRRNKRLANKQQRLQQGHQQRHQQQYPAGSDAGSFSRDVDLENPLADAWLPHSKPAVPNYAHAGVLLALGLTGHLDRLSWAELYRYLSDQHDATTIGVLLGMAACCRSSADNTVARMLFLHLPARHPNTFPEIELSPHVQAASLLGLGLLYQGSSHRLMTETMLEEIGRTPGVNPSLAANAGSAAGTAVDPAGGAGASLGALMSVTQDREGYALAAGFGLGLICLGQGRNAPGLADLHLEDKLRAFMDSQTQPQVFASHHRPHKTSSVASASAAPGAAGSSTAGSRVHSLLDSVLGVGVVSWQPQLGGDPAGLGLAAGVAGSAPVKVDAEQLQQYGISQVVLEGPGVNVGITGPAAAMALMMMYLKTGDADVAARFRVPDTTYALDHIRPELVLLMVLGRALVMWHTITASQEWISSQLPPLLDYPLSKIVDNMQAAAAAGPSTTASANIYGTSKPTPRSLHGGASAPTDWGAVGLAHVNAVAGACFAIGLRLDKVAIENCIVTVLLSLCLVMAGSGHLPTFRLVQALSRRSAGPIRSPSGDGQALQTPGGIAALLAGPGTGCGHITYGHHLAVSLAAGLLFLSAGRSSLSTSNEGIAALLIALYPVWPNSPIDQRAHLQAFRHLYVMASLLFKAFYCGSSGTGCGSGGAEVEDEPVVTSSNGSAACSGGRWQQQGQHSRGISAAATAAEGSAGSGLAFLSFCHGALYESIVEEKTAVLPWYLELHSAVYRVCAAAGAMQQHRQQLEERASPAAAAGALLSRALNRDVLVARTGTATSVTQLQLSKEHALEYGSSLGELDVEITPETASRLHVKIKPAGQNRWEVPGSIVPRPDAQKGLDPNGLLYSLHTMASSDPFALTISRTLNNEPIFDTRGFRLLFKDQYLELTTALPADADLYGLGEVSLPTGLLLPRDGSIITMWARDYSSAAVHANLYGAHPFYLQVNRDGLSHGVLLLNSNGMDVVLNPSSLTYKAIGGIFDFYFFLGPTPEAVIQQYHQVIGPPALPPYWALGFHQTKWGYANVSVVEEVVSNYSAAGLPLEVLWSDIDYQNNRFRTMEFDPDRYPVHQMRAFVDKMHERGQQWMPLVNAGVAAAKGFRAFDEGSRDGIWIKDHEGSDYHGQVWPGLSVFPDYLEHPKADSWLQQQLARFYEQVPFDGLWLDMNEAANFCGGLNCELDYSNHTALYWSTLRIPKTGDISVHANGALEYDAHNLFGTAMARSHHAATIAITGKRPFMLSRSTFPGAGRYTAHWTGDNAANWENLYMSIAGIINTNMWGIPMVGADICGFIDAVQSGDPWNEGGVLSDEEYEQLCNRWASAGAFYPFTRNHMGYPTRNHEFYRWPSVTAAAKKAYTLRYQLLTYLYSSLYIAHSRGGTLARPLLFTDPSDRDARNATQQWMLGDAVLVSPVITKNTNTLTAYFTAGTWYSAWDYSSLNIPRGRSVALDVPLGDIAIHYRGGTILPMQQYSPITKDIRFSPITLIVALPSKPSTGEAAALDRPLQPYALEDACAAAYKSSAGQLVSCGFLFADSEEDLPEASTENSVQVWYTAIISPDTRSGLVKASVVANNGGAVGKLKIQNVHVLGADISVNTAITVQVNGSPVSTAAVVEAGALKLEGLELTVGEPMHLQWFM
eukprot:gene10096-10252_t